MKAHKLVGLMKKWPGRWNLDTLRPLVDLFRRGGFSVITRRGNDDESIAFRSFIAIDGDVLVQVHESLPPLDLWQKHLLAVQRRIRWFGLARQSLGWLPAIGTPIALGIGLLREVKSNELAAGLRTEGFSFLTDLVLSQWDVIGLALCPLALQQAFVIGVRIFVKPMVGCMRVGLLQRAKDLVDELVNRGVKTSE